MAPKQAIKLSAESRKQLAHEISQFLQAHREEAEYRRKLRWERVDARYFNLRDDIRRAAEMILPKAVLDANLLEFMRSNPVIIDSEEAVDELSVRNGDASSENIDIASDAVAAFENLSIPVEKPSTADANVESVQTPQQEKVDISSLPSVIHPKVERVRAHHFRAARGNEIAFSVDGSPIVVLPTSNNDPESIVFKQMMEEDGEAFSPNSREVVSTFKSLYQRKIAEAAALPHELD